MSWRFRKVFRRGPIRWTLSKHGVGSSVGIPGLRYGVMANGQRYVSIGIPGTGLYWFKNLDSSKSPPMPPPPQHTGQANGSTPSKTPPNTNPAEPWWKQKGLKD
ncbi:MAG: DUF4236 domain-containing protein [Chloroflexi bacterium]|nr:DUF4236 domain-containing protein [Chloroflexota bacterium]